MIFIMNISMKRNLKKKQSPFDNSIDDVEKVIKALKKFKNIKINPLDTISDKIIGGLRGKRRYEIAKLVKLFDKYLNKKISFKQPIILLLLGKINFK